MQLNKLGWRLLIFDKDRRFKARTGMQSRQVEEKVKEIILKDFISVSEVGL